MAQVYALGYGECYEPMLREMRRNERKRAVLAFLASRGRPATVQEIAWNTRLSYPARGLYALLAGYAHWGLVLRDRGPDGRLQFRIAGRGRARLRYLGGSVPHLQKPT